MLRSSGALRARSGASILRAAAPSRRGISSDERVVRDAYRRYGHLEAKLDPLRMAPTVEAFELRQAIASELQALREAGREGGVVEPLRAVYCSHVGAEFEHVDAAEQREWIARELESHGPPALSRADATNAHMLMTMAEVRAPRRRARGAACRAGT